MDAADPRTASRVPVSRSSLLAVASLLLIGVALPIVAGIVSGALSVPRNDDPAYRRVALDLYSTGRLRFNGWSEMTLVGQIAFVQPFLWLSRGGAWAFAASTAVLSAAGITAGYALARSFLSVPRATLAVLGVLLYPGFLLNTTSYMTDVPTWSAEIVCLWLGAAALAMTGRKRWIWFGASIAVGAFAFSIREFGIAAPVAVLGAHLATPLGRRRGYWASAAALILVCGAIYLLKNQVPGARAVVGPNLAGISLTGFRGEVATLALILLPIGILTARSWWRRLHAVDMFVGLAAGLLVFHTPLVDLVRTHSVPRVILGNLIEPNGSLGLVPLAGQRPLLFVEHTWAALNLAALLAGLILLGVGGGVAGRILRTLPQLARDAGARASAWHGIGTAPGLLGLFALLYAVGISAWSAVFPAYDRYLWPLVLPLLALLLMPREMPRDGADVAVASAGATGAHQMGRAGLVRGASAVACAVLLAVFASVSLVLLLNADAFDTARWRAGETAVAQGSSPATVDAGFEWETFYATGLAVRAAAPALGGRYETRWPSFHLCTLVSSTPLTDPALTLEEADTNAYRLFLIGGPAETLYTYRVQAAGCP